MKRNYSAETIRRRKERIINRFINNINKTDSCWLWLGPKNKGGYGKFFAGTKNNNFLAHRYSWIHFNGEIPNKLFVLHRCDIRNCVNPSHLFLGNTQDNMDDMVKKGRQADQRGEKNPSVKLSDFQVEEIRKSYKRGVVGEFSLAGLARKYGVAHGHIANIVNNRLRTNKQEVV